MTDDFLAGIIEDEPGGHEGQGTGAPDVDTAPVNHFPDVQTFVSEFLAVVYARPVDEARTSFRWCPRWWDHAEAVSRLEALWKAFEALRLDPTTGAAVWWRDYCDPAMAALTGSEGPFKSCSPMTHKIPEDLPLVAPPDGF